MARPTILAVASAVDLRFGYGCTPAWWQLWKGLYQAGADVIVTPYRGDPVDAPWWRTADNPCRREGDLFAWTRGTIARVRGNGRPARAEDSPPYTRGDEAVRAAIWKWVTPRWERHLTRLVERESVDAVIVFSVPMSHLRGVPTMLRERFGVPVAYYDGDVPMSLPEYGGLESGFNGYPGADPGEYDLVLSNSEGALARLLELGARRAEAIFWAVDPEFFAPLDVAKRHDVFFYGHGDTFRREWMDALIHEPSRRLPDVRFLLGGGGNGDVSPQIATIGRLPLNAFRSAIAASRINLNITRRPHATVPASSTCRLFELAATGAAVVSSPQRGIERWFEPGHELVVVESTDDAVETYRELLADPAEAEELGRRARERVLDQHTYDHRAAELLDVLGLAAPAARAVTASV